MKIGARNRLEGDVTEIKRGTIMCQVKVKIAGGAHIAISGRMRAVEIVSLGMTNPKSNPSHIAFFLDLRPS